MATLRLKTGWLVALGLVACVSCAAPPEIQVPGRSAAWGYLSLVPHEGVEASGPGSGSYGDRRLRHVRWVDYSHPGFAVVYLDGGLDPETAAQLADLDLTILERPGGTRIEPAHAALAAGRSARVTNETAVERIVSCPQAGFVRRIAPGETATLPLPEAGEYPVFLLDVPGAESRLFAAPGAFSVVSSSGRFELTDLVPGRHELHAWHPRLPPTSRLIDLEPGRVLRMDLEIGVGRDAGEAGDAE